MATKVESIETVLVENLKDYQQEFVLANGKETLFLFPWKVGREWPPIPKDQVTEEIKNAVKDGRIKLSKGGAK